MLRCYLRMPISTPLSIFNTTSCDEEEWFDATCIFCRDTAFTCCVSIEVLPFTEVQWGVLFVLLSHSLHLMTFEGKFAGFTECRKQFLDFKRLSTGICTYKEWASFVSCLALSILAHTSRLMLGGAIPDNKYNSSTFVGLRHHVIARHALLSSESSL